MLAQAGSRGGGKRAIVPMARVDREQMSKLFPRLRVFVPGHQAAGIIVARRDVLGRKCHDALQKHLGIVQYVMRDSDPGEQAQRFRMWAMLLEIDADDLL